MREQCKVCYEVIRDKDIYLNHDGLYYCSNCYRFIKSRDKFIDNEWERDLIIIQTQYNIRSTKRVRCS